MSKVLFGAIVVDMRNKVGGHVFSKNKGGSFMRRKVSPTQPRTDTQRAIRAGMTTLSKYWGGTFGDPARAAWDSFAKNNPTKDIFGNTVVLTGEQTFIRLNQMLLKVGQPMVLVPPASLTVPGVSAFTAVPNGTAGTFVVSAITPYPLPHTQQIVVWATRPLSPGIASLATYYRFVLNWYGDTALPLDIAAPYTTKFGALDTDKILGIGLRILDLTSGAQSPLSSARLMII